MLQIYPVAPFSQVSTDYTVKANGKEVPVLPVRVSAMPVDQIFRGTQRGKDETELASYVHFAADEAVKLEVTVNFDVFRALVVPESRNIKAVRDGRQVTFTIDQCGDYVLEINGVHKPLHIFISPVEENIPDLSDENVIAFSAGLHRAGEIRLSSNQTLYLAPGARVKGYVVAENAENIRICGRGMIDCEDEVRKAAHNCIFLSNCKNVTVAGVLLHDAPCFALRAALCENVLVDGVKIIGQWRYNSDGIDLYNSSHALVKNCFVRTFDDCLVLKGNHTVDGIKMEHMNLEDIVCEDCVLWNDWGRALEIGAETVAEEMRNVTFRRIEVLHFLFIACDVQACGDSHVHDIQFEDISVGEPLDPQCEPRLTEIFLRPMCWLSVEKLGRVSNVTFRNIRYHGRTQVPNRYIGLDADSDIQKVALENVTVNGEPLTNDGHLMSGFIYNEYVSGVTVDGIPMNTEKAHFEPDAETRESFLIGNGAYIVL